jgi:hypothetical protein
MALVATAAVDLLAGVLAEGRVFTLRAERASIDDVHC